MTQQGKVVEAIFLGTGTSGGVPNIPCVTLNPRGCKVCPYSLTEAGRKNRRRNTSLLIRFAHPDGRIRNILVDCGKTFYEGALAWFPRYGVNSIDAVILTHGHADAMLGLDDLRPFTRLVLGGGPIRVYLTERTLAVVSGAFPYIVDASLATGGGEIPRLVFETIKDPYAPFTVEGMTVQPIPVEHGNYSDGSPFMSLGFRFDDLVYISDVSHIPAQSMALIQDPRVLIVDCLREANYISHFGIKEALGAIRETRPKDLSYFVDLTHFAEHDALTQRLAKYREELGSVAPAWDGLRLSCSEEDHIWREDVQ